MAVDMVDMAMVDTVAREKPNHTTDMVVVMVDMVESVKPKLPQNHTTEVMVDTVMVDMVDTDTVDTVESVKPKLPQLHTMEVMVDMVDMVDTDTVDTPTASKHFISNILPSYISPTFNLESFTKIQDNMF